MKIVFPIPANVEVFIVVDDKTRLKCTNNEATVTFYADHSWRTVKIAIPFEEAASLFLYNEPPSLSFDALYKIVHKMSYPVMHSFTHFFPTEQRDALREQFINSHLS